MQLLCDYAERYAAMLDGRHLDLHMAQQLSGGARVREVRPLDGGRGGGRRRGCECQSNINFLLHPRPFWSRRGLYVWDGGL